MGKIVKAARFVADKYNLEVPEIEDESAQYAHEELDDRFATPGGPLSYSLDEVSLEEPAAPEPVRQPKIDWEVIRSDAHAIIDRATNGGEAILRDAVTRAREMIRAAQAETHGILDQARAVGHDQGAALARTEIGAELAQDVASLHGVVEEARAQRNKIIEGAEAELVKLAMTIAERIVHEQITVDPNVVLENVRQAMTRLVGREVVTLRVNPADLDLIRTHRDAVATSNDVEHLRVVEDPRVDRGGIVVETDAGTIDAKISTQIKEARRTLLAEPSVFSPAQAS